MPITLRIALVENLRRLATRIVSARGERDEADKLADKLLDTAQLQPQELVPLLSSCFGKRKQVKRAFVVQLMQRLREQDPAILPAFEWVEKELGKRGRLLVRFSGTEAVARVMLEGENEQRIRSMAEEIAEEIRKELGT